ncbi:MAG: aldehyde dehydrogenase family protein [Gammaproteobacteria bacterium]
MSSVLESDRVATSTDGRLLIAGSWQGAADGATYALFDPSSGAAAGRVADAGVADVERAVEAAHGAASRGPWARLDALERSRVFWRIGDLVLDNAERLAALEATDSGRPISVVRSIDVPLAARFFQLLSSWCAMQGMAADGDGTARTAHGCAGVVALVHGVELPLLQHAWHAAAALAAGASAVVLLAEEAPLSALLLGELVQQAGVPDGALNLLTSARADTLESLVRHPDVLRVQFCGDARHGRAVALAAADVLKPAGVDIAGLSPEVICADADLDAACHGAANALFLASTQGRDADVELHVEHSVLDEVLVRIGELAGELEAGPALAPSTRLGPLASAAQLARFRAQTATARANGWPVLGGETGPAGGYGVQPTLVVVDEADEAGLTARAANRIVHVHSFERATLEAQLRARRRRIDTLGVWTRDDAYARRLAGVTGAATSRLNFVPGNRFRELCDFYTRNRFPDHALVAAANSGVRRQTVMGGR